MTYDYVSDEYREIVKAKAETSTYKYKKDLIKRRLRELTKEHERNQQILELGSGEVPIFDSSKRVDIADIHGIFKWNLNTPLPFKENYDVVISTELIGHLISPEKFIAECNRQLKVGGLLVLSARNVCWWKTRLQLLFGNDTWFDNNGYYLHYFTPNSLSRKLISSGFEIEYIENKKSKMPISLSHGFIIFARKV